MSNPFKISLFTANGIMTKTFGLEDGKLVKQRPGLIAEGTYQVRETTLPKLASGLKRLNRQQALGLGTPGHEKGEIVTASEHEKMGSPSDPIPRSKDHFIFHKQPTAMLLDIDGIAKPIDAVLSIMGGIIPGFQEAEKLIVPSSSSGLYLDNTLLKDSTSAHVYVVVKDGTLIPHAMGVIFKRLWTAGDGHIEVSRAGSLLVRSLIDASVGKPERIIYEALPILHDGITQNRPDPEHIPGEMLDLSLLPDLTRTESQEYKRRVDKAKSEKQPEADSVAASYDEKQIKGLVKRGATNEQAQAAIKARRNGVLTVDDILYLNRADTLRVRDITKTQHGVTCCDPLEPSYNNWHDTVAKIFVNDDGSVVINSNAHGGSVYRVEAHNQHEHDNKPLISLFDEDGKPKTKATLLIEIGSQYELFHDETGEGYATITRAGHKETWSIRSKVFTELLADQYFLLANKGVSRVIISDATDTLRGKARVHGEQHKVYRRVAALDGKIFIDLCDAEWRVVEVSADSWRVVTDSPVKFLRSPSSLELPEPHPGGNINDLWKLINVKPSDRPLVAGFLVRALQPDPPYLCIVVVGEQGTGKSFTATLLRALSDPSTSMLRPPPKDDRDFLAGAANNWCLTYDNLSGLQPWLSDSLCRVLTGGSFAARTLYTTIEETTIPLARPVILNGIDDLTSRPDLADRAIVINLQPIRGNNRVEERKLWEKFNSISNKVFGVILSGICSALRTVDEVELSYRPRMLDAAKWATAAEEGMGLKSGTFLKSYEVNQRDMVSISLESSPFIAALLDMVKEKKGWAGSPTELQAFLPSYARDDEAVRSKAWPKSPAWVTRVIRRHAPSLRKIGVDVEQSRDSAASHIKIVMQVEPENLTPHSQGFNEQRNNNDDLHTSENPYTTYTTYTDQAENVGNVSNVGRNPDLSDEDLEDI